MDVYELFIGFVGLWCFFFFKQKTAYEMRISDWSSDVCSSDLVGHDARRADVEALSHALGLAQDTIDHLVTDLAHEVNGPTSMGEPALQIGRASCRDRVCQYV